MVVPMDVPDVLVAGGVAGTLPQVHGARGAGWRGFTPDGGLVVLGRLMAKQQNNILMIDNGKSTVGQN